MSSFAHVFCPQAHLTQSASHPVIRRGTGELGGLRNGMVWLCWKTCSCQGEIWLAQPFTWGRQHLPQPAALVGVKGHREDYWLQQLDPWAFSLLHHLSRILLSHICLSSQSTKGNPLSLLKQQQIKALFEACRQANIYFICSVYIHALKYLSKLKGDHLN